MTGLGEIIQAKRKELGLTQERLAEKIGKTAGYIGQIERGLSYPSYPVLFYPVLLQLIETLELDVQSLFCTSTLEESAKLKQEYAQLYSKLSKKQQQLALGMLKLISRCDF